MTTLYRQTDQRNRRSGPELYFLVARRRLRIFKNNNLVLVEGIAPPDDDALPLDSIGERSRRFTPRDKVRGLNACFVKAEVSTQSV